MDTEINLIAASRRIIIHPSHYIVTFNGTFNAFVLAPKLLNFQGRCLVVWSQFVTKFLD